MTVRRERMSVDAPAESSWWGRVQYRDAVARMEEARRRLLAGDAPPRLFLCEHSPVITVGRSGVESDVVHSHERLRSAGIELAETNRGGRATYHGPGQLMVYPVLHVGVRVVDFLRVIAGALGVVCEQLSVPGAAWRRDPAGLWVGERKIAACGLHLRRGVAIHGFALNVDTPPTAWEAILPCGLSRDRVTSVAAERRHRGNEEALPPVERIAEMAAPVLVRALSAWRNRGSIR